MIIEPFRYETDEDVHMRLHKSVVRYKGRPVYVESRAKLNVWCHDIDRFVETKMPEPVEVHSSDSDLDIRAFSMGYINLGGTTAYAARLPVRRYRQGLNEENYVQLDLQGRFMERPARGGFFTRSFADMMFNRYPTAEVAVKTLADGNRDSLAIGKKLCLVKDELGLIKVHYFTTPVAFLGKNGFMVPVKFQHYQRILGSMGLETEVADVG